MTETETAMKSRHLVAAIALVGVMISAGVSGCKKAEDYYIQGRAYVRKKQYDRALTAFSKAIDKNPEYARAYFARGLIHLYYHDRDRDRALSDFNKAIEIDPKLGDAYAERAMVYLAKEEYDRARADVQKAQDLGVQMSPGFLDAVRKGPERKRKSGAAGDERQ
jgi:tetratricopeptide (TPR) repeat protein